MLNRSAVVIIPKQPFLDWVNSVDDVGTVTADDMQKMIYLVPDYEDPADADKVVARRGDSMSTPHGVPKTPCGQVRRTAIESDIPPHSR